jgi:hypothetical protein
VAIFRSQFGQCLEYFREAHAPKLPEPINARAS